MAPSLHGRNRLRLRRAVVPPFHPHERHMRDAAGRRDGLDFVVLLEALQPVPEADTAAEQDQDHHDVHVVDQSGRRKLADHGGASAEAHVLAGRSLTRRCRAPRPARHR